MHKYIREEDVPEHTIFIITTDGMENASRTFSSDEVKRMVEEQRGKGWEFIFLGANIDAVETAKGFGIAPERAANYRSDRKGTKLNYDAMSSAISMMRCSVPISDEWRKDIDEEYNGSEQKTNGKKGRKHIN